MTKQEKDELIDAWIQAQKARDGTVYENNWWAIEKFMDLPTENPEIAWELILAVIEKEKDEELLGMLAAGPLEDLMCEYGDKIIDRIEIEATNSSLFKRFMQGVWLDSKDTSVWKRFYEIAQIEPPFEEKNS